MGTGGTKFLSLFLFGLVLWYIWGKRGSIRRAI